MNNKVDIKMNTTIVLLLLLLCLITVESFNGISSSVSSSSRRRLLLNAVTSVQIEDDADLDSTKTSSSSSSSSIITLLESKLLKSLTIDNNDNDKDISKIDKVVKGLESQYMLMPIQTSQFLTFAISGKWRLLYSSFPTPQADKTIMYNINQIIKPTDGIDGELNNIIDWKLNRDNDDAYGKLTVVCNYKMTSRGGLEISLNDHLLNVEKIPQDVQELLTTMQRTVPFEFFDPDEYTAITTYVDPQLKIVRMSGETFTNLINIFIKDD